jgi:hypothetical protein
MRTRFGRVDEKRLRRGQNAVRSQQLQILSLY